MAIIFDGRGFARGIEDELKVKVSGLKRRPKLVSILLGRDPASLLYTKIKKKAAERVGVVFEVCNLEEEASFGQILGLINKFNRDKSIDGIMIQLPLPRAISSYKSKILNSIDPSKDVDGLGDNSLYMPAVVKAIKKIVEFATKDLAYFGKKASVVGAGGNVGRRTVEMLSKIGYKVTECDQETRDLYAKLNGVDLIVSATGVPNLIKGEMIKEGAIAIDVGSPRGDFDFDSVSPRAGFITPVPGGVGPLTVVSLLENLVEKV